MKRYVVFAGEDNGNSDFHRAYGYLCAWIDNGILNEGVIGGEAWKERYVKLLFPGDSCIGDILQGLEPKLPKRYTAIRAEVLDEEKLKQRIPDFLTRFSGYSQYAIYTQ